MVLRISIDGKREIGFLDTIADEYIRLSQTVKET